MKWQDSCQIFEETTNKWNFELTVFKLTVPNLYEEAAIIRQEL